ncbi:MAG: conjugal transfer protein [Hyphomicrobiales bacterium]|nr:conjugal transfer protein [Hyphomicrobiales bacterium]MDE2115807.1 conjugal transfer protein [Hyphomicrobiales bacterium]
MIIGGTGARAQGVPVIDSANLSQSTQIAQTTASILAADQQIQSFTQKTLAAVTGDRTSQSQPLAQMATGGGFSMASAPSLGSVISGGALSFAGLGSGGQTFISTLINGLQLVKTLSGLTNGQQTQADTDYQSDANVAGTLAGLVNAVQQAATQRAAAFASGGQQIGTAPDLKGSIDQNSQIQVQAGLVMNEVVGATNNATAAINQQNIDQVQMTSAVAKALQ